MRSYRISELRLSAVISIEEFPKSGSGVFLKKQLWTLFHAYAVTHRLEKAMRNNIEYGIRAWWMVPRSSNWRTPWSSVSIRAYLGPTRGHRDFGRDGRLPVIFQRNLLYTTKSLFVYVACPRKKTGKPCETSPCASSGMSMVCNSLYIHIYPAHDDLVAVDDRRVVATDDASPSPSGAARH